ncbi:hypothetical protein SAY87_028702 [Trapa incisa]|uniref:Copper transport protein n=2 Tax=Trapa TaxID=22665 RepID=A0AAN7LR70_TRANT|nr:hypothetical protein SAY87_028702 [Trapa incisa]KAK4789554.1 hypothetical protein SAY86_016858 [Trapa natans]
MVFSWAKGGTEIFFPNWPGGHSLLSYSLTLLLVFLLSTFVEWLSHARLLKLGVDSFTAGILQTAMYAGRTAAAYLVMLAVMSFDGGMFLSAVCGYSLGFLIFGSQVFRKWKVVDYQEPSDLPPLNC